MSSPPMTRALSAGFEGAPAGVAPFTIATRTDRLLGEISGGLEVVTEAGTSVRFGYQGSFGENTRQQWVTLKVTIPF